ncbi:MAG: DNA (cytosine-5-)-methyltransferase [Bacteroidales bacterium]|jgi:DNA (cytosine-5)-methyltransferase 1
MADLSYIDLFAGAGGLSEGFNREGYKPIAHVEMDKDASDTLKTRETVLYLNRAKNLSAYYSYLKNEISRDELWSKVPEELFQSVINVEISLDTIPKIFRQIRQLNYGRKVDVIIGGPPCQAYSLVGRSRDPNGMKNDARNYLFRYYAQFLFRYKPKYFVFENVLGILTAGNRRYLNEMIQLFESIGYSVAEPTVLLAEEYGVLQKRRRVVVIGRRGKRKFDFPQPEVISNSWQIKPDLFYDLPKLKPGDDLMVAKYIKPINQYLKDTHIRNGSSFVTQHTARPHNEQDLEIYKIAIDKWINERQRLKYSDIPQRLQSHNNTVSFLDRFKVVDLFGHSHTLVAHIAKDGHYYIYPDLKQVRSISVREAARIQSFPDDYYFEGGRTAAFKQIGNAVPPLMAQAIAKKLLELF